MAQQIKSEESRIIPSDNVKNPQTNSPDITDILGNLFSIRRPRDLPAGFISGIKTAARTVTLGLSALIVLPYIRGKSTGPLGILRGLGEGIFLFYLIPTIGFVIALCQIIRGAINTPQALLEYFRGRKWDHEKRIWKNPHYSLDEEIAAYEEKEFTYTAGNLDENFLKSSMPVKETKLYDILEVTPDVDQEELKRKWKVLSMRYHPDKNDDPKSTAKFQEISQAYQILSDDELRKQYDIMGSEGLEKITFVDPTIFFTILYGCEDLTDYVGPLSLSVQLKIIHHLPMVPESYKSSTEQKQWKREIDLAVKLRDNLPQLFNSDHVNRWLSIREKELNEILDSKPAARIMMVVGSVYVSYSEKILGKYNSFLGLQGRYLKWKDRQHQVANQAKIFMEAVKLTYIAYAAISSSSNEDGTVNPAFLLIKLKDILESFHNFCLIDTEITVRESVKRILKDDTVPIEKRLKLAKVIIKYGKRIQKVAKRYLETHKEDKWDETEAIQNAYKRALEKKEQDNNANNSP